MAAAAVVVVVIIIVTSKLSYLRTIKKSFLSHEVFFYCNVNSAVKDVLVSSNLKNVGTFTMRCQVYGNRCCSEMAVRPSIY